MPGSFLAALIAVWHRLLREFADPYRPELHYMRGPGPKCQAKDTAPRGRRPAATVPSQLEP